VDVFVLVDPPRSWCIWFRSHEMKSSGSDWTDEVNLLLDAVDTA